MQPSRLEVWTARAGRLGLGAAANVVAALGGAIRNKILATVLQTAGMGVLAQVQTSQVWLGVATGLGLGIPVTQSIGGALGRGDDAAVRRAVWTALSAMLAAVALVAVTGLIFAKAWASLLLGPHADPALVLLSLVAVAGLAAQGVIQGIFAGRSDVRAPLTYAIVGNVVMLAAVVGLVVPFGLRGAVIGVGVFFPAAIAGALWWHRREYAGAFRPLPRPLFHGPTARAMLKVAAGALGMSLLDQGTMLAMRTHYAHTQGYAANGLVQAALALTQQTGAVFYVYLGSYAFGKVSGAASTEGIRAYTQRQFAAFVAAAAVAFALVMLLARPLLRLLFSTRFEGAEAMMNWTLFGEFAKVAMQAWMFGALPLGGLRLFVPLGVSYPIAMGAGYLVALRLGLGPMSVAAAYAFAGVAALVVSGVAMTARRVPLTPRGALVLAVGLAALCVMAWLRT
jgi:O-antigen/teichoic acid export membrane protein